MRLLLLLFFSFFKIGMFTFGGGYAMIPIIEDCCVYKRKWISEDEMMEMTVLAESTPGPIAINCATYVGYKQKGILGGILATLGVVLPSFIIILAISFYLNSFLEITAVANAFKGIKIAVGVLIFDAGLNMLKKMKKTPFFVTVFSLSFGVILLTSLFSTGFSSMLLMLAAALGGIGVCLIDTVRKRGQSK